METNKETIFKEEMGKGHSAAWDGDWQKALEHYSNAQKNFPENSAAVNSLALAQFELGDHKSAQESYESVAKLSPEDPQPIEKIAQISLQLGKESEALEYFKQAAALYVDKGEEENAIRNWTFVVSLDPVNLNAHSRLARTYEKLGQTGQAITEYIAVASLLQRDGKLEEAKKLGKHSLKLDPENEEAVKADEQLSNFQSLPVPTRRNDNSTLLDLGKSKSVARDKQKSRPVDEKFDPLEEASQIALNTLANMLLELSLKDGGKEATSIRSIAKVVADGILSRGYDEKEIVKHLSKAIDYLGQKKLKESAEEIELSIDAGLDHPAAHFELGALRAQINRSESAQRSFQRAVKHADFALASRLMLAYYLQKQKRAPEAIVEYLQALKIADSASLEEAEAKALGEQYELLIEAQSANEDLKELEQVCENIRLLLFQPGWRAAVDEARKQLQGSGNGNSKGTPLGEILSQANSGYLVEALSRVNRLAAEGHFRSALEATYAAMDLAPTYLPLHIKMAEIFAMDAKPRRAIDKFGTIARVYSARGEAELATEMYERIVDVSPMDTKARELLIDQITGQGNFDEAIAQYLKMADVYYRLAQLVQAKETYEKALRLAEDSDVDVAMISQILRQMADIDMQRLDWRSALDTNERLLNLSPNDEETRHNLVQLNLRLGDKAKAGKELDDYLTYLRENSEGEIALAFLQKLADENSSFAMAHRRLAEHYQANGDDEKAIATWHDAAKMLDVAGDKEGAKVALRAILSMNPSDPEPYQQYLQKLS
jgi:tetratricopeptide (TPR) repeat protein